MWLALNEPTMMPSNHYYLDYPVHGILQARILEWVDLSLLQGIFPTQESNWNLLHCRRILYQLSYQPLGMVPFQLSFPGGSDGKESACNVGDPGSGRSPREGHDNPLPYSCLENPMDRRAWQDPACRVAKSQA